MIEKPTVCAIMITANRPELAKRAVEGFRAQTYYRKRLCVLDTGLTFSGITDGGFVYCEHYPLTEEPAKTIGELRNWANQYADDQCLAGDIICTFDDDDFSSADRIAEQVDLLQASGADLVAYNQMLFWRTDSKCQIAGTNEAWIYTGGPIGTSFCYWRKTWEKHPFEPTSYGEDNKFWRAIQTGGGKVTSVSSLDAKADPMMIAGIHGSNTSNYDPQEMRDAPHHWRRAAEHDAYCRKVME